MTITQNSDGTWTAFQRGTGKKKGFICEADSLMDAIRGCAAMVMDGSEK